MNTFRILAGSLVLIALLAKLDVAQADGPQAVTLAVQHAGLAAGSDNIASVRRHLHHVLNCLVGPDGEGFDETQINPCTNAGPAIPQTADGELKETLEQIAAQIRDGIGGDDLAAARELATEVQRKLVPDTN